MSMQLSADVALRAALRIRINPPNRQSVPEITRDTGITAQASDHWRSQWQRQGQLLPASSMPTEQCSAAGRLAAVIPATRAIRWRRHHCASSDNTQTAALTSRSC